MLVVVQRRTLRGKTQSIPNKDGQYSRTEVCGRERHAGCSFDEGAAGTGEGQVNLMSRHPDVCFWHKADIGAPINSRLR
jgi:hypothetical protein